MERYDPHSVRDDGSLMVISHKGKLRKLVCPFRVLCIRSVGTLLADNWYFVEEVTSSNSGTCYYIQRRYYVYYSFHIYVMF